MVKSKAFFCMISVFALLALAAGISALAQDPQPPERLSGIISDLTGVVSGAGPWEMRGHWALHLKGKSGKADFSAYMTMELSDYGVQRVNKDPGVAANRSAHTHHIVMTDATVSTDPADLTDITKCPAFGPANTPRLLVTGPANFITGNGNDAPFEKNGTVLSTLYVCISGATYDQPGVLTPEVQYSNMTLIFGAPASTHFGTDPVHGVVRFPHKDDDAKH
jgi:hypothetical protein